jgi:hypothetical protein
MAMLLRAGMPSGWKTLLAHRKSAPSGTRSNNYLGATGGHKRLDRSIVILDNPCGQRWSLAAHAPLDAYYPDEESQLH